MLKKVITIGFLGASQAFILGCVEDPSLVQLSDVNSSQNDGDNAADKDRYTDGADGNVIPGHTDGHGGDILDPEGSGDSDDGMAEGPGGDGSNGDGNGGVPGGVDDRNDPDLPAACQYPVLQHQTKLAPDVAKGANVVFLIDDSGSMREEIAGVVNQIENFVDGLLAASDNNYRVLFLFDERMSVIRNNFDGNPFADQIAKPEVSFVREETWSSWADIAFFKAFAQDSFMQDAALASASKDGFADKFEYVPYSECNGAGDYFRARSFRRGDLPVSTCISSDESQKLKIEDRLIPGTSVSVITLSDDDIAASPAVAHDMFKQVLKPLGNDTPMIYHSIVGVDYGNFDDVPDRDKDTNIDRKGQNHAALSALTGGKTHDITDYANYASILSQIKEDVILGAQAVELGCPFRATLAPVVTFNGMTVNPDHYVIQKDSMKVNFLPDAFIGFEEEKEIDVVITY